MNIKIVNFICLSGDVHIFICSTFCRLTTALLCDSTMTYTGHSSSHVIVYGAVPGVAILSDKFKKNYKTKMMVFS